MTSYVVRAHVLGADLTLERHIRAESPYEAIDIMRQWLREHGWYFRWLKAESEDGKDSAEIGTP